MNSEIFSRLERLMKSLMLSVEEGTYTRAEMKAYAAGIELAALKLEDVMKNRFADTASTSGLAMFLSLIGKKPAASQEESRRLIREAISAKRRALTNSEFEDYLSSIGLFYVCAGNQLLISSKSAFSKEMITAIVKLINDYVPCTSVVVPGRSGLMFDKWDGFSFYWFELDGLNLPFNILDTL